MDKNFPDEKLVFLGVHAKRKHRHKQFCYKKVRRLYVSNHHSLYVCLKKEHSDLFVSEGDLYDLNV